MKAIFFLAILGLPVTFVQSSEVDSFNQRYGNLKDSTDQINDFSNKLFDKVLGRVNADGRGCNDISLYENLRKEFRNHLSGEFSKYISYSPELDRIKIKTANSIYEDFTTRDSLVLGFYSRNINDPIASAINIRGHFVGTDKFEHFAGTGFRYFKHRYLKKNSLESTMDIGTGDENGLLGAYTTGVISYGDMVAEFNGMRFWNHVLQKNDDVLGVNLGPYAKCEGGQWQKVKEIDFGQYVDDGWDEGINCSRFRTQRMVDKIVKKTKQLEELTGHNYTCPIDPKRLENANTKYGPYAKILLNNRWQKKQK